MIARPDWRKGDVIVAREGTGLVRVPFVAEHGPVSREENCWRRHTWNYGNADASEYRLATHEDVKIALMDTFNEIDRRLEWMRKLIELISRVRAQA